MTWFDRGNKPPRAPRVPVFPRRSGHVEGVNWQAIERRVEPPVRRRTSRRPPSMSPSRSVPPAPPSAAPPETSLVSRPPGPRISVSPSARAAGPDFEQRARYEEAIAKLEQAVCDLVDLKERVLSHEQDRLAELAGLIAKRVIGRELSLDPTLLAGLAVEGIVALGERDNVAIRVGPLLDEASDLALHESLRSKLPKCEVIRDESLEAGDCVVETSLGRVDESLGGRLDAALRAMAGEGEEDS